MEERRKKKPTQQGERIVAVCPWIPYSPPRAFYFFSCLLKNPLPPHRREWPFRDQGTLDYFYFFFPSFCDPLLIAWGKREAEGWGEQGRRVEKIRVFLQTLHLEITQGEKSCSLTWVVSKSSWVLLLFLLLLFFFLVRGGGRKRKKKIKRRNWAKKHFEGLILASIQTDVACHSVVKQAADWSKQQQFRGNCSRTAKWETQKYRNIFFFSFFLFLFDFFGYFCSTHQYFPPGITSNYNTSLFKIFFNSIFFFLSWAKQPQNQKEKQ